MPPPALPDPTAQPAHQLAALHGYRRRLEDQLRLLQRKRTDEAKAAAATVAALSEELSALEKARAVDLHQWESEAASLRADNALLTAATMRMHEQWSRDAVELEALRVEMRAMDAGAAAVRAESQSLLHRGAGVAEERYRRAERRRAVDVRVLAEELGALEQAGSALLVDQQLQHLRLLADARCVGRELEAVEAAAELEVAAAAAREEAESARREASTSVSAGELSGLSDALALSAAQLDGVVDSLRTWEACDAAERAHALLSADRLETAARTLDEALHDSLTLPPLNMLMTSPDLRTSARGATPRLARSRSFTASGLSRGCSGGVPEQQWARSPGAALGGFGAGVRRMGAGSPAGRLEASASAGSFGSETFDDADDGGRGGALLRVAASEEAEEAALREEGLSAAIAATVEDIDEKSRSRAAQREWLEWLSSPRSTPPGGGRCRPTVSASMAASAKALAGPVFPRASSSSAATAATAATTTPRSPPREGGGVPRQTPADERPSRRSDSVATFPVLGSPGMPSSAARAAAATRERDQRKLDPPLQCTHDAGTRSTSPLCKDCKPVCSSGSAVPHLTRASLSLSQCIGAPGHRRRSPARRPSSCRARTAPPPGLPLRPRRRARCSRPRASSRRSRGRRAPSRWVCPSTRSPGCPPRREHAMSTP